MHAEQLTKHPFSVAVFENTRRVLRKHPELRPGFHGEVGEQPAEYEWYLLSIGFLSYSTQDRSVAADVKAVLASLGVDAFMAHEDIHVSQQWRDRILSELNSMQVFVLLLSDAFKKSEWTAQEIGVAVARPEVLIVPASLDGTVPFGFIGALQGRRLPSPPTEDFFRTVIASGFPRETIARLIDILATSSSWRGAERNFEALVPFLGQLTREEAERIVRESTRNSEIWDAGGCRATYLPAFLAQNRHHLSDEILRPLEYQIEHEERYIP